MCISNKLLYENLYCSSFCNPYSNTNGTKTNSFHISLCFIHFQDVYPFKYILMEPGKKNSSSSSSNKSNEKTKWEEYEEAVRDVKISWLSRLGKLSALFD